MKTRTTRMKLFAVAIVLAASAAVWAAWGGGRAQALPRERYRNYQNGMFGITRGQTARLHVLNHGMPQGLMLEWKFLDSNGDVLAESTEEHGIAQGRALSFDLNRDLLDRAGNKVDLYVFLTIEGRSIAVYEPGFIATVEVMNNSTGKTEFFASPFALGP